MAKLKKPDFPCINLGTLLLGIVLVIFSSQETAFSHVVPSICEVEQPSILPIPQFHEPTVHPHPIPKVDEPNVNPIPQVNQTNLTIEELEKLARETTVRIKMPKSAGSGVILNHQGEIYTVLTNRHVIAFQKDFTIITADGQKHQPISKKTQHLGNADLAIIQFKSTTKYQVAKINSQLPTKENQVFASGFPLYKKDNSTKTLDLDIKDAFWFTQGEVSLVLKEPQSLPEGYSLGYTNDIQVGMSGGPIFNSQGELIGVNGRTKYRDPAFGVYRLEDGTNPKPEILDQMINSSWGIPISIYQNLVSSKLGN